MKKLLFLILLTIPIFTFSQEKVKVLITINFEFPDGIYLDFKSLKNLSPIDKKDIITNLQINDVEFFKQLVKNEKISFFKNGIKQSVETKSIWGYANNGILYINNKNGFFRVPVVASISQFVAQVKVIRESMGDPFMDNYYYYNSVGSYTYETKETRSFLISFTTGIIYNYNYKNLEALLSVDEELFKKYTSLRKRQRKQQMFLYIKKFNEKHPLYFYKIKHND